MKKKTPIFQISIPICVPTFAHARFVSRQLITGVGDNTAEIIVERDMELFPSTKSYPSHATNSDKLVNVRGRGEEKIEKIISNLAILRL